MEPMGNIVKSHILPPTQVGCDVDATMVRRAFEHFRSLRHPRWALLHANAERLMSEIFRAIIRV